MQGVQEKFKDRQCSQQNATTNSQVLLAREKWQTFENSFKKHTIFKHHVQCTCNIYQTKACYEQYAILYNAGRGLYFGFFDE